MAKDPTLAIRRMAATLAGAAEGASCTQASFKVGKAAFLYIGPGAKGIGFKAMFKLDASIPKAQDLAAEHPDRFEVGANRWVTARFTAEKPLAKSVWERWLHESHALAGGGTAKPAAAKRKTKPAARKKTGS